MPGGVFSANSVSHSSFLEYKNNTETMEVLTVAVPLQENNNAGLVKGRGKRQTAAVRN